MNPLKINQEQIIDLLIQACPSYRSRAQQYFKENYEPGDERLYYLEASDFNHFIIDLYIDKRTEDFNRIFDVIEELHINGDDYVKELATIGFLESLQHHLDHENIDYKSFETYLKQESLKWWKHLIDFWNGNTEYVGGPLKEK